MKLQYFEPIFEKKTLLVTDAVLQDGHTNCEINTWAKRVI